MFRFFVTVGLLLPLFACLPPAKQADAFEPPELVSVPAGPFITGSGAKEREFAYQLDEAAYGHSRTRQGRWYAGENPFETATTEAFEITQTPITNALYSRFVSETGHPAPNVDEATWTSYRLIHPYERTRRHAWVDGKPPAGRADHPVVMISLGDAQAFAKWLSEKTGRTWRLPTGLEWEKAARGPDGQRFPWGNAWDPTRLNSHDQGPFDTLPVGSFPSGASPYGLLDGAGQVYEWTSTPHGIGRFQVRGGSWDDSGCGVCRSAARHGRPKDIKHILIGFRLVAE
ncbi:MAG: SUMF1/EgtB/PvdO family nonheme iron enzyme [Pseudomonadota bacterium]